MAALQRGSVGGLFRGRIWSPSPSQAALSLGTRRGRGTQVPAHPNNVRPLARSGQCLASPAQSPAGSPPHSPQAPLNFGRGRSIVVGTLAPCPSPPPPAVEGRYREPGMGGQRHGPDLHFQPGAGALLGTQASQSPASLGPRPARAQRSNQARSHPPVPQSPASLQVSRARRKASGRAGLCTRLCACACACGGCGGGGGVCPPYCGDKFVRVCVCVRECVCACACARASSSSVCEIV